jgi:signal transduction histidine kinase
LKPLAASLDHLLARLRHKIQRERAFVQDAAHELRTPMAVISAQAHVLATSGEVHRHEAAQQLDRAIARGSHLIEQMLQLARVDHELSPRVSEVDVARLARQVLAQRAPAAMARSMELSLDAPDLLRHALDVQALHSVLHNLVDNAIRYGNTGGRIVVALRSEAGALLLSVADDGPGIPMQDREMVFERFYRGADHDASGSGLGLAIVKQAVARMFGTVTVQTGLEGRGCSFAVSIPVDRTPA